MYVSLLLFARLLLLLLYASTAAVCFYCSVLLFSLQFRRPPHTTCAAATATLCAVCCLCAVLCAVCAVCCCCCCSVLFIFTVQIFTHFILLCEVTNFLVYCKGPSTEQKLGCEHEAIEAAVPAAIYPTYEILLFILHIK